MQKARRHPPKGGSDRLRADGFRIFFTPLSGVLFTFPSRYSSTIGLRGVFSLAGWSRQIHAGLHVSRATQDAARREGDLPVRGFHPLRPAFPGGSSSSPTRTPAVLLPRGCVATTPVWAAPRSLATTCGITLVFSSCGY